MRAQFITWIRQFVFKTATVHLGLEEYHYGAGYVVIQEPLKNFSFNFHWPGKEINNFSSYHSFCLAIDKRQSDITVAINGKVTLKKFQGFIKTSNLSPGKQMKLLTHFMTITKFCSVDLLTFQ